MPQNKEKRDNIIEGSAQLPGWPGYRNRPGRSGLDPIENNLEGAFFEGLFYRKLFTLQLRSRKPSYLIAMFLIGTSVFAFTGTFLFLMIGMDFPFIYLIILLLFLGIPFLMAAALLLNLLVNLLIIARVIPNPELKSKNAPIKPRKKRLPKRRKDYR